MRGKILAVVPRRAFSERTLSGVGIYINGLETIPDVDIIYECEKPKLFESRFFEKYANSQIINFGLVFYLQKLILIKLRAYPYKVIVCSTYEGVMACIALGLPKYIPVYYRSHNSGAPSKIDCIGFDKIHDLLATARKNNVKVLANCTKTLTSLKSIYNVEGTVALNIQEVPDNLPNKKQSGLLYISRHDSIKRPKLFAEIVKATGLKAKILTNSIHQANSWKKTLDRCGVSDYDIRYGLSGDEKWEFIASAKAALSTSLAESFGLSILETAPVCPTFIVKTDYEWWENFDDFEVPNLHIVKQSSIVECLKKPRMLYL